MVNEDRCKTREVTTRGPYRKAEEDRHTYLSSVRRKYDDSLKGSADPLERFGPKVREVYEALVYSLI